MSRGVTPYPGIDPCVVTQAIVLLLLGAVNAFMAPTKNFYSQVSDLSRLRIEPVYKLDFRCYYISGAVLFS